MSYDQVKEFNGRKYTGMSVGGQHHWVYPNGLWEERKVAPDRWEFTFSAKKEREGEAPFGSGAPLDTRYHWYIIAHQRVRKLDRNTYSTVMAGEKYKLAHRRPNWHRWSNQYPDRPSERETVIAILEDTLSRLKRQDRAQGTAAKLTDFLRPRVPAINPRPADRR